MKRIATNSASAVKEVKAHLTPLIKVLTFTILQQKIINLGGKKMIVCPQCKKELADGTKFCDRCGASLANAYSAAPSTYGAAPATAVKTKKKIEKKWYIIGVAIILVVAILAGIFFAFPKSKGHNYALYIKDDEIFYSDFSKKDPWQVTSDFLGNMSLMSDSEIVSNIFEISSMFTISKDGKYIFFIDKLDESEDGLSLYYRRVGNSKKEAVKIASDVSSYSVNESATMVIYKTTDGGLYQYEMKSEEKDKIASDISSYYISEDFKNLFYKTGDNDAYFQPLGKDKEKVDSDVSTIEKISDDATTVYYTKDDILYKKSLGEEKVKIASDISIVSKIYDSGEMYYYRSEEKEISLADYIEDDMAAEDANLTEPQSPSYPSWWDYDSDEAYEAAYEEYQKQYEAYEEAYNNYRNKSNRDNLRNNLKDMTLTVTVYTFCYNDGKKETVLGESYNNASTKIAMDKAVYAFYANDAKTATKIKISEIEDFYNVTSTIRENLNKAFTDSAVQQIAVGGTVSSIQQNDIVNLTISDDGSVIYFMGDAEDKTEVTTTESDDSEYYESEEETSSSDTKNLYMVTLSGGKAKAPVLYDTDVSDYTVQLTDKGKPMYFKEVDKDNSKGELYFDKTKVDFDVSIYDFYYDKEDGRILYFTDVDQSDNTGTFKIFKGNKAEKVADDVYTAINATANNEILYLADYNSDKKRGDLYIYDGKSTKLDTDVTAVLYSYTD